MKAHRLSSAAIIAAAFGFFVAAPARAAFHLWNLNEVYTNSSGTLQFIELSSSFGSQQFVGGQQVSVDNIGNTINHTFVIPSDLPGDTTNKKFLIGTAGIQAAGGPAPDYIMPNGFLFQAGGSIGFFGANSGPYSALPTDGTNSRTWSGGNAVNTPTNFAGQTGQVVVPEPVSIGVITLGGACLLLRRRRTLCDK